MDSEKYIKLETKLEHGGSPTDEGPFYHHSWWESYKGSIKGKLGGTVVGAIMGVAVGTVVATLMATGILGAAVTTPIIIGGAFVALTGAGILYGIHEFGQIGKIVGSDAATQEQADAREAIRFAVIEKKIDALANAVTTGKPVSSVDTTRENEALESYRKTHYAKLNGSTKQPIFWKIALIGLAVGAAAGAILATGGTGSIAFTALEHALGAGFIHSIGTGGVMATSMTIMGMFGASFGINRDIFRKMFDVTDLWSKGMFGHHKVKEHQEAAGKEFEQSHNLPTHDKRKPDVATAVAPDSHIDYPASATFHRDRIIAATEKALHEFDHTRSTPH